ncbi:MAG: hypothetical protein AAGA15_11650 [Pseudomonadota bacterium]
MSDVDEYLKLTRETMPALAKDRGWPVSADHCFQRIVLDHIAGGTWYDHIPRPAYKHLTNAQARAAVALCEAIIDGSADLHALNRASLAHRGKLR